MYAANLWVLAFLPALSAARLKPQASKGQRHKMITTPEGLGHDQPLRPALGGEAFAEGDCVVSLGAEQPEDGVVVSVDGSNHTSLVFVRFTGRLAPVWLGPHAVQKVTEASCKWIILHPDGQDALQVPKPGAAVATHLHYNQVFDVVEEAYDESDITWLRVADGQGWVRFAREDRRALRREAPSKWFIPPRVNVLSEPKPDAAVASQTDDAVVFEGLEQVRDGASETVWLRLPEERGWVRFAKEDRQIVRRVAERFPFVIGQRVRSLIDNHDGIPSNGEAGTIITIDFSRPDEYNVDFGRAQVWLKPINIEAMDAQATPEAEIGEEEVDRETVREGILPACKPVYEALLVNDISPEQAEWDNPLIEDDQLIDLLEAIDRPENPLFVHASPIESIKWYLEEAAGQPRYPALLEVEFPTPRNVMVVGDLHGRLGTLRRIHALWLKLGMPYVVGVGDMVDRGNRQVEVAVAFLAWRCQFPDKVMVLHGNHENAGTNKDYGLKCVNAYGPHKGIAAKKNNRNYLFQKLNLVFDKIPTALIARQPNGYEDANGVFMHGGFGAKALEASKHGSPQNVGKWVRDEFGVAYELQWNEAMNVNGSKPYVCRFDQKHTWFGLSQRDEYAGNIHEYGDLITQHFLKNLGACALFTGHSHDNTELLDAIAQTKYNGDMNDPRAVASLGGCQRMRHFITLSAHRFFVDCSANKTRNDRDCQGRVTMVRLRDRAVEMSQENIFGFEGELAPSDAEKVLDIGVGSGHYPNIARGCQVLRLGERPNTMWL